jgi:hypothetical protein
MQSKNVIYNTGVALMSEITSSLAKVDNWTDSFNVHQTGQTPTLCSEISSADQDPFFVSPDLTTDEIFEKREKKISPTKKISKKRSAEANGFKIPAIKSTSEIATPSS